MSESTILRYLEASSLDRLFEMVEVLPFKIEYKQVIESKGKFKFIFTLPDGQRKFTNEVLKELTQ
tara:strand:- start:141 stop:335 length:195 start_codon:yes stop_codon:yes gene_type:complete